MELILDYFMGYKYTSKEYCWYWPPWSIVMHIVVEINPNISSVFCSWKSSDLQSPNNKVRSSKLKSMWKNNVFFNFAYRRTPILGKHSKRITCGAWSKDNILALGSEDKTFSLSSEDGDSLRVIQLRDIPSDMCFAEIKTDERVPGENTVHNRICSILNLLFFWFLIDLLLSFLMFRSVW